jgi:serine/threonine protein kinase
VTPAINRRGHHYADLASLSASPVAMQELFNIDPSRLEWDPNDRRKVSQGGTLLGEGTFGSVFRGQFNHTYVAIKVIKNSDAYEEGEGRTAAEQQHVREIRRLLELKFQHVVQCLGISKSPITNHAVIVTECLEGGALFDALQVARINNATLTDISFLTIASHIAKGLLYIHQSGFIHGDMKPHNVLLSGKMKLDTQASTLELPPNVDAKIADFGMSKRVQAPSQFTLMKSTVVEKPGQAFGTFAYMAPEIFAGVPENFKTEDFKRVDIYAFGVVLYEMLAGVSPWQLECVANPMQLYHVVCTEQRRPAWGPRSDKIRPEYKRLIERCWDHKNWQRPGAENIIAQLNAWIRDRNNAPLVPGATSTGSVSGGNGAASASSSGPMDEQAEGLNSSSGTELVPPGQSPKAGNAGGAPPLRKRLEYWEERELCPVAKPYPEYDPGESVNVNPVSTHTPSLPVADGAVGDHSKQHASVAPVDGTGHTNSVSVAGGPSSSPKVVESPTSSRNESADPRLDASHVTQESEASDAPRQGGSLLNTHESTSANEPDQVPVAPSMVSSEMVVQQLHEANGEEHILKWWNEGHMATIAATLSTLKSPAGSSPRFCFISELLRRITDTSTAPTSQMVARDMCIAFGNATREPTMTRESAQGGITLVLKVVRSFSCVLSVYGTAFYALANLLKISNDFPDDLRRREVAGWLSHAMSYNLNAQGPESRVPTLVYTTACAVRNFVWINDANAQVFLEPGGGGHGSAFEQLLASLASFRLDPTIAEACLSAFAALAYYPRHRVSLVRAQVVSAVSHVLCPPPPSPPATFNVLLMGLSTLGILVSGPVMGQDGPLICASFQNEGGIICAIYAMQEAIAKQNVALMEASMSAVATIARFNRGLRDHTVRLGGVAPLIQSVMYAAAALPVVSPRCAEMMCVAAYYLVYNDAAKAIMRQNNAADLLAVLIARYPGVLQISSPGQHTIAYLRGP